MQVDRIVLRVLNFTSNILVVESTLHTEINLDFSLWGKPRNDHVLKDRMQVYWMYELSGELTDREKLFIRKKEGKKFGVETF
jgi:hypothetical protein